MNSFKCLCSYFIGDTFLLCHTLEGKKNENVDLHANNYFQSVSAPDEHSHLAGSQQSAAFHMKVLFFAESGSKTDNSPK